MKHSRLIAARVKQILTAAHKTQVIVVGDAMLDHFIWGSVARISPEAPVPVVDFARESFMPGGAANVARNLTALNVPTELFGVVGQDISADQLKRLLAEQHIGCKNLLASKTRPTSVKTRIVAHKQQVVRIDRETRDGIDSAITGRLLRALESNMSNVAAIIVGDYGKGVVTQPLLEEVKSLCRKHAVWLSLDPKPVHDLNLTGLSLITPNRKEAFELARLSDDTRNQNPLADANLMGVAERLLNELHPAMLLITLGELGMLLCQRGHKPFHIPTVAQEVFDVSGAGDTVIATFTLAIAAGASPVEAAILSNHAAGIVVGKIGTATVAPEELLAHFQEIGMEKITAKEITAMKGRGEKIAALTAYDFPMTRLLDQAGIPLILVGDSLGMVVLGYSDTTEVTMADVEHHTRAAARAKPRALLAADLPYRSYETVEDALRNAKRLVAAGAEAVKAEGGRTILEQVKAIVDAGIPFLGHLGMLPQHVREEGGYHVKGKVEVEKQALLADADALVEAGAFAIVLELVTPPVAQELSQRISIPTIGIGAGPDCDGQILVTPDLLGMLPWYSLKHVKPKLNAAEQMRSVVADWKKGVETTKLPKPVGSSVPL